MATDSRTHGEPAPPIDFAEAMPVPWHRILGMAFLFYLRGSPWRVEAEVDTAFRKKFIDIVITQTGGGAQAVEWPDGLGELAPYNVMTFKSVAETLNLEALLELIGYASGYCTLLELSHRVSISVVELGLFAVTVHHPQELFRQLPPRIIGPGVYDIDGFGITIRVLVTGEFPKAKRNVVWNLFSGKQELVESAVAHLLPELPEWSSVLNLLLARYNLEGIAMPYTEADFMRDVIQRIPVKERLAGIPPAERLAGIPPAERLAGIPPAERLAGIPPAKRLAGIPPAERLAGIPPAERLAGIPPAERLAGIPPAERLAGISAAELRKQLAQLEKKAALKSKPKTSPRRRRGK